MGKAAKPISKQKGQVSKTEKKRRKKAEEKLKGKTNELIPPEWLSPNAKLEFDRVVLQLKEMDIVSNLDLSVIAIYCDAYANYIELTRQIQINGAVEEYVNTKGAVNMVVSSYCMAQTKYIDIILKCASKLGLTVTDRLKLTINKEEDIVDPLIELLRK